MSKTGTENNKKSIAGWKIDLNHPAGLPMVTVAIPTLNEEKHIFQCLRSIEAQTYPTERMEILVIDGLSTDKTREKIREFALHSSLKTEILDNPGKIQARALNIGVRHASGNVFVRMDAHSIYNPKYVETAVKKLAENDDTWNVGGYLTIKPANNSEKALAFSRAFANPFGGGNATYRTALTRTEQFVDTVPFGAYPIHVFNELGMYNEYVWIGEDIEFNKKILNRGKKILITPEMSIDYTFKPATFKGVWRRNYRFGECLFRRKKGRGLRHFIPMLFLFFILSGPAATALNPIFLIPWAMGLLTYLALAVFFILRQEKTVPSLRKFLLMLSAFMVMHTSFGTGSIVSMIKYAWRSDEPEFKV